ncbi:DUF3168 domain-containing protein [Flavobacterium sp.]|jgi:hypothetical protein|uniref:tail completion protein gp17 n=1 Tax=Flavobacterium sp. TaxID=239 RepID=UPI0037BFB926
MNAEIIIANMLAHTAITALVGNRRALGLLPQNSPLPAVVYQLIDSVPTPSVSLSSARLARARVQINPLAKTIGEVKAIHHAVRSALDHKHQIVVAGKTVVSCTLDSFGPVDNDFDSSTWTQPADYLLVYYE